MIINSITIDEDSECIIMNKKIINLVIPVIAGLLALMILTIIPYETQFFFQIECRRFSFLTNSRIENFLNLPTADINEISFASFEKILLFDDKENYQLIPEHENYLNSLTFMSNGKIGPLQISENVEVSISAVEDLIDFIRIELINNNLEVLYTGNDVKFSGEGIIPKLNDNKKVDLKTQIKQIKIFPLNGRIEINAFSNTSSAYKHQSPFVVRGLVFQEESSDNYGIVSSIVNGSVVNSLNHQKINLTEDNKFLDFDENQVVIVRSISISGDTIKLDIKSDTRNLPPDFKESKIISYSLLYYLVQRHLILSSTVFLIFLLILHLGIIKYTNYLHKVNNHKEKDIFKSTINKKQVEAIKILLSESKTEKALELIYFSLTNLKLEKLKKDYFIFKARFNQIRSERISGIYTTEEYNILTTRLIRDILDWLLH